VNIIVPGELLTTVENISNLLPAFKCKGEGWIFFRSTPATAALEVEFVWVDWEYAYAYRTSPSGKPRIVKVMSMTNTGSSSSSSSMIHCFVLQNCIWDVHLIVLSNYLYLSIAIKLSSTLVVILLYYLYLPRRLDIG
jgi:hypothetical protein